MRYLILVFFTLSVLSGSLAYASLSPLDASPNIPSLCKISNTTHVLSCAGIEDTFNMTGSNGIKIKLDNTTHSITVVGPTPNNHAGTYNQTYANNVLVNSGGHRLNFLNGTNSTINLVNDPTRNQINITVSSTGGGGGGSGVSSLNALTGALTIACVAGNTTCTTAGGNTITINTAYNIATLNLNEIFSGITTMNNLKLGGQMNINNKSFQSLGHVYTWPNNTGTVCLTNQTGACGPGSTPTYDTMENVGTGEGSIYKGNSTNTNFQFKTLKQGSHITLTNNTNDVTIGTTGLLSSALLSLNGDTTAAQVVASGNTNHITVTNAGANHSIDTAFKVNNATCSAGNAVTSYNNVTGVYVCSPFGSLSNAITSVNSQTGPSISIIRQPGYTTITNTTNTVKVGIDATGVMELNGTQIATGSKTFNALVLGGDANAGSNGFTNAGHKSTFPLTTGTLCQTNQSSTCGTNSGVTSLSGSSGNITVSASTGAVTINTGTDIPHLSHFNNFTNHNIIIASGGTSPIFQIISNSSTNNLFMDSYGATTNIQVRRADGTISSPSALQSNDVIGGISARGYGATGFGTTSPGQVRFTASGGNWNDTSQPTAISFLTTPVGSITSVVGLIITPYQALRLSQIGDPSTVTANDLWKSSTNADVIKYRNNAGTSTYNILSTLSAVNATRGQLSGNGTGTSSATMVMDGVYATITPANTGRITVMVTGVSANSVATDGCNMGIRQGTSNMGANGAVVAGTILGDNFQSTSATAAAKVPFSRIYDFSGPIGTKQFFDLSFSRVTGGTCTLTSINWDLVEH